jgi:putative IMPACT (imprinted ancient) family translation regulator
MSQYCVTALKKDRAILCGLCLVLEHLGASEPAIIMLKEYQAMRTLTVPASFEVVIKRSRFIAHASRVDNQADTLDFYESVADPAATHNCWAWRLDYQYRFNDDGEPASTAGRPILSAIEGKGLDNVMVVRRQ